MSHEINLVLGAKKILSVNSIYSATIIKQGGKQFASIYKSREAKNIENWIGEQIKLLDIAKNYPWVTKNTLFSYSINVIFKNGYLSRDLDNTLKLVQDGIFRALDVNDSHVVQIFAKKSYLPDISEEKICISLREFTNERELRIDYIPTPTMIWTEWDKASELGLKEFGKKKMKGQVYLVSDKSQADTKLIVIDPEKINYNTLGEVYLEVMDNLSTSSGLVYIALDISKGILKEDLLKFKNKIEEMSRRYTGIKIKEFSENLTENIKEWIFNYD